MAETISRRLAILEAFQKNLMKDENFYGLDTAKEGHFPEHLSWGNSPMPRTGFGHDTAEEAGDGFKPLMILLGATVVDTEITTGELLLVGPEEALIRFAASKGLRVITGVVKATGKKVAVVLSKEGKIVTRSELKAMEKAEKALPRVKLPSPRRSLLGRAQDPRLKDAIENLYRPNAKFVTGSSMDALLYEKATGQMLSKTGHRIKLLERRSQLLNLIHDSGLTGTDREIIIEILKDIQHALSAM